MSISLTVQTLDHGIQLTYVLAIGSVFLAKYHPKFHDLLKYGKTLEESTIKSELPAVEKLLQAQVPKRWFYHFYLLSLLLSASGFYVMETAFRTEDDVIIRSMKQSTYGTIPVEISRLVFFLLAGHSFRRLIETLFMMKFREKSMMNISHYLVGVFYYATINIQSFLNTNFNDLSKDLKVDWTVCFPVSLFILSTLCQFLNHLHLSKLVKYNVPSFGMFRYLSSAHYFDEILIYTSVLLLVRNLSSALSLLWVIVNLSASAIETHRYYKLNNNGKVSKWAIIPFFL